MSYLSEVQIITDTGLPVFYYSEDDSVESGNKSFLQAGFMSAMSSYSHEMENGDLELIKMQKKSYIVNNIDQLLLIFTAEPADTEVHSQNIEKAGKYLQDKLANQSFNHNIVDINQYSPVMDDFSNYLIQERLVPDDSSNRLLQLKDKVREFIYNKIGYVPGQCNIGPEGKNQRIIMGMTFLLISVVLFSAMLLLELSPLWFIGIFFSNFMAMFGIVGSYYSFCAMFPLLGKGYDMR